MGQLDPVLTLPSPSYLDSVQVACRKLTSSLKVTSLNTLNAWWLSLQCLVSLHPQILLISLSFKNQNHRTVQPDRFTQD